MSAPRTRWEIAGEGNRGYGAKFGRLVADGVDVDGEARLADALVGRGARILDVGSGMGRVAAAEERAGRVRDEAEDQRVEHDDVGHRQERDDAASDLPSHGRAAFGDPEVAVDAAAPVGHGAGGGTGLALVGHGGIVSEGEGRACVPRARAVD